MNRKANAACNSLIETGGLLRIAGSHVHYEVVISRKRCKIETMLQQIMNRKWYMTYQTAAIPMTLSDLQAYSSIASLLKWNFSYSCAAADKISTDKARRAVPLRQLNLLLRYASEQIDKQTYGHAHRNTSHANRGRSRPNEKQCRKKISNEIILGLFFYHQPIGLNSHNNNCNIMYRSSIYLVQAH